MESSVDQQFFEGAEKLLEVWFSCSSSCGENDRDNCTKLENGDGMSHSLRSIPRAELDTLVEHAHCRIVSQIVGKKMDSYVLSESSLFVSDRRLVIKTCGSTSLLATMEPLMQMARQYCGLDVVAHVFYSRKNFLRPELQPQPHKAFEEEVSILEQNFENGGGYCLGRLNQDRWYLYSLNNNIGNVIPDDAGFPDQTLEVLMSDLDQDVMSIFTNDISCNAMQARKLSEMDKLFPPGTVIDEKLFDPCGYSMNGVIGDTDQYVTIHITPQAEFSYVSYETNVAINSTGQSRTGGFNSYHELIRRVIVCFKPGRFLVTMFANKKSTCGLKGQKDIWENHIPGYCRRDLQFLALPDDVCVLYGQYTKQGM